MKRLIATIIIAAGMFSAHAQNPEEKVVGGKRVYTIGIEEGNVFVTDSLVGRKLPQWSCNPEQCNKTGLINIMYLDLTGGKEAFTQSLLAEENNVVLRLSFRLRGSARAGDVFDLIVEDAVFAASDESQSLAMNHGTLKVKNGKIVVGD